MTLADRAWITAHRMGHIRFSRLAQLVRARHIPLDLVPEPIVSFDDLGVVYTETWLANPLTGWLECRHLYAN